MGDRRRAQLTVIVRDWGAGLGEGSQTPGLGMGLPLLRALSEDVELVECADRGVEVRMTFSLDATADTSRSAAATARIKRCAAAPAAYAVAPRRRAHAKSTPMQSFNQGTLAVEHVAAHGRPPYTVLRLGGEHDLATADAIRAALLTTTGAAVIVDLTECTFADSSIISALLQTRADHAGFAVVLPSDPASAVVRAFTIAGVTAHLTCCASLDDARRLIETDDNHLPGDAP